MILREGVRYRLQVFTDRVVDEDYWITVIDGGVVGDKEAYRIRFEDGDVLFVLTYLVEQIDEFVRGGEWVITAPFQPADLPEELFSI